MNKGEHSTEFREDIVMEGPDYRQITASDLRRVLKSTIDDTKNPVENALTVYPHKGGFDHEVFAFWGKRFPNDQKLHRIAFSAETQAHFQELLHPEEDRWDKELKTPTGLPMQRSDPDAVYRGPNEI